MPNEYFPNAFYAFYSDIAKYRIREIIAKETMLYFKIYNEKMTTPWKINIFRIEEFQTYQQSEIRKVVAELKLLNGKDTERPREITCVSPHDISNTLNKAQGLLKNNLNMQSIVERAKSMNLNYIIQGVYEDTSLIRVDYKDDDKAYKALTGIVARLAETQIVRNKEQFNRRFFAYTKDNELKIVYP